MFSNFKTGTKKVTGLLIIAGLLISITAGIWVGSGDIGRGNDTGQEKRGNSHSDLEARRREKEVSMEEIG